MRTTIDIPDATYQCLKVRAAQEGSSVKQLILRGAENVLREPVEEVVPRLSEPPFKGGIPGSMNFTNAELYELLDPS